MSQANVAAEHGSFSFLYKREKEGTGTVFLFFRKVVKNVVL